MKASRIKARVAGKRQWIEKLQRNDYFRHPRVRKMRDKYPGAADAVELCEHLQQWPMFRRCAAEEGIAVLKENLRRDAGNAANKCDSARREVLLKALSQWDHPDFDKYLMAKLGAM